MLNLYKNFAHNIDVFPPQRGAMTPCVRLVGQIEITNEWNKLCNGINEVMELLVTINFQVWLHTKHYACLCEI